MGGLNVSVQPVFARIAIIGIGLIGSSIARASLANGAAGAVRLFDVDTDVRDEARRLDLGEVFDTAEDAARNANCVILCVPVGRLGEATAAVAPALRPGAILSDVGSVKLEASRAMVEAAPDGIHVIPAHPIAGTEQSGPASGFASLFDRAWQILCPLEDQTEAYLEAVARLEAFWTHLGARVEIMPAARHDRVLAITSHLPHLIAYNIVSTAYDMESVDEGEVVKYSAGGFRDFTRIAASDPIMWRDVFLNNREAVLECLGRFSEDLAALQRAIRHGDGALLIREFERARGIRKAILDAGLDSAKVNFGRDRRPPENRD
ncbi:MAG: prephenate/arogenate dehydrogenase family protein [Pseudomonadota bacterium]